MNFDAGKEHKISRMDFMDGKIKVYFPFGLNYDVKHDFGSVECALKVSLQVRWATGFSLEYFFG